MRPVGGKQLNYSRSEGVCARSEGSNSAIPDLRVCAPGRGKQLNYIRSEDLCARSEGNKRSQIWIPSESQTPYRPADLLCARLRPVLKKHYARVVSEKQNEKRLDQVMSFVFSKKLIFMEKMLGDQILGLERNRNQKVGKNAYLDFWHYYVL